MVADHLPLEPLAQEHVQFVQVRTGIDRDAQHTTAKPLQASVLEQRSRHERLPHIHERFELLEWSSHLPGKCVLQECQAVVSFNAAAAAA